MTNIERQCWLFIVVIAQGWSVLLNRLDFVAWLAGWLGIFVLTLTVWMKARELDND